MTLARVWTRQLYGASGVALLAPVTMIAALGVLALSGGFGGLSALSQLFSGPAVPVASTQPGVRVAPRTVPLLLPVVPAGTAAGTTPARAPTHVAANAPSATGTGGAGARSGQRVASTGTGATATPPAATPPSTATPAPVRPAPPVNTTPAPPPATGPVPALVNQVVAVGVSVTSKLPAPVAAIGTGALESIGQALNTLLTSQL